MAKHLISLENKKLGLIFCKNYRQLLHFLKKQLAVDRQKRGVRCDYENKRPKKNFFLSFFLSFFLLPPASATDNNELFTCARHIVNSETLIATNYLKFENLQHKQTTYQFASLGNDAILISPASDGHRKGFIVQKGQDIYFYPSNPLSCSNNRSEFGKRSIKLKLPFPVKNPYIDVSCINNVTFTFSANPSPSAGLTYQELDTSKMLLSSETLLSIQNMIIAAADWDLNFCRKYNIKSTRFLNKQCHFSQTSEFNEVRARVNAAKIECSPPLEPTTNPAAQGSSNPL